MLWNLFIFRGHSRLEPASTVSTDEQGDLSYSAGLHRDHCQPQPTQKPPQKNPNKLGRGSRKKEGEWTGWIKLAWKKSLAVSVECKAIYGPASGLKGEPLSFGLSTDGPIISASAVPLCGRARHFSSLVF